MSRHPLLAPLSAALLLGAVGLSGAGTEASAQTSPERSTATAGSEPRESRGTPGGSGQPAVGAVPPGQLRESARDMNPVPSGMPDVRPQGVPDSATPTAPSGQPAMQGSGRR